MNYKCVYRSVGDTLCPGLVQIFSRQVLEDAADFHFKMEMGSNVFPQWKQWNSPYSMFKISHSLKKDSVFAPKSYILLLPGLS